MPSWVECRESLPETDKFRQTFGLTIYQHVLALYPTPHFFASIYAEKDEYVANTLSVFYTEGYYLWRKTMHIECVSKAVKSSH